MLRLALETSSRLGGVGLADDDTLLAESSLSVRAAHAETVLPEVERVLDRAGRDVSDVGEVVVGSGPGSFTGLRIGAALAKGLCAATGAGLRAYGSLTALAVATALPGRVCVLAAARGEEVYAAAFGALRPLDVRFGPAVLTVEEVLDALEEPGDWRFAGEGAFAHRQAVEARGGRVLSFLHRHPRVGGLLELAVDQPDAGRVEDPGRWEPEYVRASGARRGVGRTA